MLRLPATAAGLRHRRRPLPPHGPLFAPESDRPAARTTQPSTLAHAFARRGDGDEGGADLIERVGASDKPAGAVAYLQAALKDREAPPPRPAHRPPDAQLRILLSACRHQPHAILGQRALRPLHSRDGVRAPERRDDGCCGRADLT